VVARDACHICLKDGGSGQNGEMELLPFGCEGREGSQFRRKEGDHASAIKGESKVLL